jgi:hypothetical protein
LEDQAAQENRERTVQKKGHSLQQHRWSSLLLHRLLHRLLH